MSSRRFLGRSASQHRDLCELRSAAAEFYRLNRVHQDIEGALNELFVSPPPDLHGSLANYFTKLACPPRISQLKGREVYDAKAQLSIEAEVLCVVCNQEKSMSSAAVSCQLQWKETSEERNAESAERVDHVTTAVQWISGPLSNMLKDQNPCDQSKVDQILREFFLSQWLEEKDAPSREMLETCSFNDPELPRPSPPPTKPANKGSAKKGKKSNIAEKPLPAAEPADRVQAGSVAIGSVSLAVLKSGARVQEVPLYKHIGALRNCQPTERFHIPLPLVTLLCCGQTSPGKLSLLEEVLVIPKGGRRVQEIMTMVLKLQKEVMRIMSTSTKTGGTQTIVWERGALTGSFERPEQPLDVITDACANLGLPLGEEIHLALNCAAPLLIDYTKGKYEIAAGVLKSPDELLDVYHGLLSKHPAVVALIDPFRREDSDQWERLHSVSGSSCSLLSDITYKARRPPPPGVKGHIIRHTNEMTISDLIQVTAEHPGSLIMGTTNSEPCNEDSFSDIAVGLGLDFIKVGGLSGAEHMAKYNRLMWIEEELDRQGNLVLQEELGPPLNIRPEVDI